jgi:hypothetical protein
MPYILIARRLRLDKAFKKGLFLDIKDILKKAKDPRYISGIYNYCDRWCERCIFTSRCLNYAIGEEDIGTAAMRDINNKEFWDKLHLIFQQTIEMMKELAAERGIDLSSFDIEVASDEISRQQDNAKNHDLSLAAHHYLEIVDSWFESEYSLFEQRQDELNSIIKIGIGSAGLYKEAAEINDSVEVICWYQHQIYVKLVRALSHEESVDTQEEDNTLQKDSDGSVLVALIAIDRSMGAWGKLQEYFPAKTDSIMDILLHLDRLRRMTEKTFPDARNFKRPGFHDVNS